MIAKQNHRLFQAACAAFFVLALPAAAGAQSSPLCFSDQDCIAAYGKCPDVWDAQSCNPQTLSCSCVPLASYMRNNTQTTNGLIHELGNYVQGQFSIADGKIDAAANSCTQATKLSEGNIISAVSSSIANAARGIEGTIMGPGANQHTFYCYNQPNIACHGLCINGRCQNYKLTDDLGAITERQIAAGDQISQARLTALLAMRELPTQGDLTRESIALMIGFIQARAEAIVLGPTSDSSELSAILKELSAFDVGRPYAYLFAKQLYARTAALVVPPGPTPVNLTNNPCKGGVADPATNTSPCYTLDKNGDKVEWRF